MSYMKIDAAGTMVPVGVIVGYQVMYGAGKILKYRDASGRTQTVFPTWCKANQYAKNMKLGSRAQVVPVYSNQPSSS